MFPIDSPSCRFRPSARPQRLFAARGGARDRDARQIRQGGGMPALGDHRHQHLFGALEFSREVRQVGHPADIGARSMIDFADAGRRVVAARRSTLPARRSCCSPRTSALSLVDAARLQRLAGPQGRRRAHVPFDALTGCEGLVIALTGGPAGAIAARCADMADFALAR